MITYPTRYMSHHLYVTWHEVHAGNTILKLLDIRSIHVTPSVHYLTWGTCNTICMYIVHYLTCGTYMLHHLYDIQCTLPDIRYMPQSMLPTQETLPAGASKYLKHDQVFCHCLNKYLLSNVITAKCGILFTRLHVCYNVIVYIVSVPA